VNWNGLRWLPDCFNSLAKQDYKNYEIIFVDNNSTDKTYEIMKEYHKKYKNVIKLYQYNINVSKVNNKTPDEKKLVEEKNKTQIQKLEKLAEQNSSAYSALANIYLASISLMDSNHSKALYYYQRISKDASFSQTLQEYAKLIEINTKLQYSPSIYETPLKQLDEYFAEYVKPDNTIDIKLLNNKSFSNAMALTAIATNDINDNNSKSKLYLEVLKQYEKPNDNIKFINLVGKNIDEIENEIYTIIDITNNSITINKNIDSSIKKIKYLDNTSANLLIIAIRTKRKEMESKK
jgi:glycosyltransferase involved in cell wall biosynthesis